MKLEELDNASKKCMSVRELADLYNISRQTVLLYDKTDLLKPHFRNVTNGYRYYHFKEYTKMEIIHNLRVIGVPISEIKQYLENRSLENLQALLDKQTQEYHRLIQEAQTMLKDMEAMRAALSGIDVEEFDVIRTREQPAKEFYLSSISDKSMPIKDRIMALGANNLKFYKSKHFKYFFNNYLISLEDYQSGLYNQRRYYCIPAEDSISTESRYILPEGTYLTYRFKGLYRDQSQKIWQAITKYVEDNALTLKSDVLICTDKNFWITTKISEYISTLYIKI